MKILIPVLTALIVPCGSWCAPDTIFCTSGQEPDNDRGPDTGLSGKTQAELHAICERVNTGELTVCAQNPKWGVLDIRGHRG